MSPQNGRRGNCAKYIHTADPVGVYRKSCLCTILEYSVLASLSAHRYRLDQLYVGFWRNFLVVHFAGSSIYNSFIYGHYILYKREGEKKFNQYRCSLM